MASVDSIQIEINTALVDECNRLRAEVDRLEQCRKESGDVMGPVLDYAHSLNIAKLGQSVTQALIADHKRLTAELGRQHESHRTTWTQLEQAKREIARLKGESV